MFDLKAAGIDLRQYGEKEFVSLSRDFRLPFCDCWIRLIEFNYGPEVQDWMFRFSEPSDEFAGEFWAMIEGLKEDADSKQPQVPGSWIEDELQYS